MGLKTDKQIFNLEKIFGTDGLLASRLVFYEARNGQRLMAEAVVETFEKSHILIVEAGTGIGKTLAYLIPSLLSGLRVVISTGTKNLQEQIYFKDIPLLSSIFPFPFKSCLMKGRSNYLCRLRFANLIRQNTLFQLDPLWETIKKWGHITKIGDRSEIEQLPDSSFLWNEISCRSEACLGQACSYYSDCFLNRLKQSAAASSLIIVNHHLFMADLSLREETHSRVIPEYAAIVFDEAHELEQTATHYFGVVTNDYRFDELIRDTERELSQSRVESADLGKTIEALKRLTDSFFSKSNWGEGKYRISPQKAETLNHQKTSLLNHLVLLRIQLEGLAEASEELRLCARRAGELGDELEFVMSLEEGNNWVYWVDSNVRGVFLNASPIDVSEILREKIFSCHMPVILTSATLSAGGDFKYLKKRIGITAAVELIQPSEFDFASQTALYIPRDLPEPNSPGFVDSIGREILQILSFTRGRALLLFTSYRNLEQVYDVLKRSDLPYQLLKQGDMSRNALLNIFKKDVSSVLLATSSFWQGVDVQGEALSCVVIDKLPFASPGEPLVEARIEAIRRARGDPFSTYQLPETILELRQGLGRLIRNKSDKGLLVILDSRLLTKRYGTMILRSLPPSPVYHTIEEVRQNFHLEHRT